MPQTTKANLTEDSMHMPAYSTVAHANTSCRILSGCPREAEMWTPLLPQFPTTSLSANRAPRARSLNRDPSPVTWQF